MDSGAGARVPAPAGGASPRGCAACAVVTPAGVNCETAASTYLRESCPMIARQMPNQNHPLTRAYMLGARATNHASMSEAMRLIHACERAADRLTIDQCKLAAEILIERKMP
jgi:hypothetical protein